MALKLAEALLRRKELEAKVKQLASINIPSTFKTVAKRVKVTEDVDDFLAQVPQLQARQVTAEYDHYAKQLRLVDAVIQQANWQTEVEDKNFMQDYQPADIANKEAKVAA
jgi:hypothetical protein